MIVLFAIILFIIFLTSCFNGFLVKGNTKIRPTVSVTNPGVNNNTAPINIQIPSNISSVGGIPLFIWICARLHVSIPCHLAIRMPKKPVSTIKNIIHNGPVMPPIHIKTPISIAGISNSKSNSHLISYHIFPFLEVSTGLLEQPYLALFVSF